MTAAQLAQDHDPTWPTDCEPSDHTPTPTPTDCRQHELRDLDHQGIGAAALRTAHTIDTQEYL